MKFATHTSSIPAAARRGTGGFLPKLSIPLLVLTATIAVGCSEGDPKCLFGCECQSPADCDDGKECTLDFCGDVNGVPMCEHPPEGLGVACTDGGGRACDGAGNCVECNQASDCPDDGEECTGTQCEDVDGTPRCDYPPEEQGVSCSSGGGRVCDGAGSCVECNQASDCPEDGDACTVATCSQRSCGVQIVDCPPVLTGSEHEILEINNCPDFPGRTHWRLVVDYEDLNGDVTPSGTRLFVRACFQEDPTNCSNVEVPSGGLVVTGDGFRGSAQSRWCTGFGESDWVDNTVTIRDAAGNQSNPVTERVPRPPGAN